MRAPVALLLASCALAACDESVVWHKMHPTLERMLDQRRGDPYAASAAFPDGRAMRPPPPGTIARGSEEPPYQVAGEFVDRVPYPVTRALLERGRGQFEVTCAACHGILGDGKSVVAEKMEERPPPSLLIDRILALRPGEIEEVVENGYGLMASYDDQLPDPLDRWAVVAYVGALQLSQHVEAASLPADMQRELARGAR